jgi:hypothetical protein
MTPYSRFLSLALSVEQILFLPMFVYHVPQSQESRCEIAQPINTSQGLVSLAQQHPLHCAPLCRQQGPPARCAGRVH